MINVIHDDFKRTADFHHNILLNLRVEYKTLNTNMQRDLTKWRDWNLPEVHSAALNYYKNYSLYLQYKIESHQKYYDLFQQKYELLDTYINQHNPKPSRFASVKSKIKNFLNTTKNVSLSNSDSETSISDYSQYETEHTDTNTLSSENIDIKPNKENHNDDKEEDEVIIIPDHKTTKKYTHNIYNNDKDPLLSDLSITTKPDKQYTNNSNNNNNNNNKCKKMNIKNLNRLNKTKTNIKTISQEEENILLKANSIKIDSNIKQLEDNINSLQLIVDSLYIIYDKSKDNNKKLDPIERKQLLESILEDSSLACLPTSALNPLSAINDKNNHIIIDGITYFPFNDALYDRLDLFLKDKRYREGVFVDRWILLCRKNILNLLNKKNTNNDFYNKLINETLRILKIEYNLNIIFPDDESYNDNKEHQTFFSILQLGVERFYFSRLKRDIINIYKNTESLKKTNKESKENLFQQKQRVLRSKLELGDFDVIGIKKNLFSITEYLFKFSVVIKEIEIACKTSAPTDITYHLVNTVRLICEVLKEDVYGKEEGLSADSIFPYIVFVLIYTNVTNMNEIFWYLEKVAERKTRSGEMGVCVSMTHAATVWINEYKE